MRAIDEVIVDDCCAELGNARRKTIKTRRRTKEQVQDFHRKTGAHYGHTGAWKYHQHYRSDASPP
eukprot:685537-Amphidinium_carterae.1